MRRLFLFALLACIFFAVPAEAQFIGFVSPQTISQNVATNAACNAGITVTVPNQGQTVHSLSLLINADPNGDVINMALQASNDGVTFFQISDKAFSSTLTNKGFLNAPGYYPVVQAVINCATATTRVSATYIGSSVTQGPTFGDPDASYYDKVLVLGQPANAGLTPPTFTTPYGNLAGFLSFQYTGGAGPAGSTLTLSCTQLSTSGPNYIFSLPTATQLQIPIAPFPCETATVSYTSGGASAALFNVVYLFHKPGFSPGVTALNLTAPINGGTVAERGSRWSTTNNPAAGTQASASRAAGPTSSTRHVADCVTASAGASAAPAATNLALNLRDGASGAGTIIWLTQIVAAATAAQHGTVTICGLNLIGSANTAMTLEFSAGLANEFESVTLTGYDVQ